MRYFTEGNNHTSDFKYFVHSKNDTVHLFNHIFRDGIGHTNNGLSFIIIFLLLCCKMSSSKHIDQ